VVRLLLLLVQVVDVELADRNCGPKRLVGTTQKQRHYRYHLRFVVVGEVVVVVVVMRRWVVSHTWQWK